MNFYLDATIVDKLSQIDDKSDKILALLNDRLPKENPNNLMSRRVAALKKLERTQEQIDKLIGIVKSFNNGVQVKEHADKATTFFIDDLPPTLDEYIENQPLQYNYIIDYLTNIRNNMFKE